MPFAMAHDVGLDPGPFMGEELAGAAHAGLDLVEDQDQALLVAKLAQGAQEFDVDRAHAPLALDRLDDDGGGGFVDDLLQRRHVVRRHLVEAFHLGPKALQIFRVAAGGDAGQGTAVKAALEADDAEALGIAVHEMVAARHLEGELAGLRSRIGEEHRVGKSVRHQLGGQHLLPRHPEQVGCVPELAGLVGERLDQLGIGMAERVDRDPRPEIQVSPPILGEQPGPFAPDERDIRPVIGGKQCRKHFGTPYKDWGDKGRVYLPFEAVLLPPNP